MRTIKILFYCHLAALVFGLAGLLIFLPHPDLWDTNPIVVEAFNVAVGYTGSLHILFGAATMLLFGLLFTGTRKTLIFFVVATAIPLSMELLGTSTGFPFGPYSYTSFLGFKIAGLVPYSIPLSWFYMGFTSYILASGIVTRVGTRHRSAWSLALGVYFLTVWDLALDPAMASQRLPVHFWIWHQQGPYFGMPVSNLIGWSLTGLLYMGISRALWRGNLDTRHLALWLPYGIYVANTTFAIALNLSVGLWLPVLMAVLLGLLPASLALLLKPAGAGSEAAATSIVKRISRRTVYLGCRALLHRKVRVRVEGLEYVPRSGSVVIAARHFHHLYDGCILLTTVPRTLHIFVALDWIQTRRLRGMMEWACTMVDWPVMLRGERLNERTEDASQTSASAYAPDESPRYLRRAVTDAVRLLRRREALVIFPEAYPTIDPTYTPKNDENAFLPFRPGLIKLVEMAERDGQTRVAIVPAGLTYMQNGQWHVTLRFGPALFRRDYADATQLMQALEEQVYALSSEAHSPASSNTEVIHS